MAGLKQLMIHVPESVYEQIEAMAEKNETTTTAVVRVILLEYLKAHLSEEAQAEIRGEIISGRKMQKVMAIGGITNLDDELIRLI